MKAVWCISGLEGFSFYVFVTQKKSQTFLSTRWIGSSNSDLDSKECSEMPFSKPASQLTVLAHSSLHAMANYE